MWFFKDLKVCLNKEVKEIGETDIDFINNDKDYLLFLPIMYGFELFGLIEIINIDDTNKGYFVRFNIINDFPIDKNKIWKIECTESGIDKKFSIFINGSEEEYMRPLKKGSFKILYDISREGKAKQINKNDKSFKDQIDYLNKTILEKGNYKNEEKIFKYISTGRYAILSDKTITIKEK